MIRNGEDDEDGNNKHCDESESVILVFMMPSLGKNEKTSQELQMRSKSLSDCQSLTLNVMIAVNCVTVTKGIILQF